MVELNRFFWFFKLIHILVLELTSWIMHYNRFYIYPMWAYLNNLLHSWYFALSLFTKNELYSAKESFSMNVLQVNSKLVTTAYSQPMNLVQTEPKLTVQIAKTAFVIIPSAEEINRAISPLLKHRPTSTGCFLITEHFKFAQTIRIDFIHSTDLVTGLVDFSACSSCKLKAKWQPDNNFFLFLHAFYSNQDEFFVFGTRDEARSVRQV